MRWMLLPCLFVCAGCLTPSGRRGTGDLPPVLKEVYEQGAQPGDPKVKAAGRVAEGVRRQTGGPVRTDVPTAEELDARADAMEQEELAWKSVADFFTGLIPKIPYVGGALAAALALWKTLRASKLAGAATAGVVAINKFKHLAERFKLAMTKGDTDAIWTELDRDASILLNELQQAGQTGSAAWKELTAIHDQLKSKGRVVDLVGST